MAVCLCRLTATSQAEAQKVQMNIPELLNSILFGCLIIGGVCAALLSMLESDERHYPDVDHQAEVGGDE